MLPAPIPEHDHLSRSNLAFSGQPIVGDMHSFGKLVPLACVEVLWQYQVALAGTAPYPFVELGHWLGGMFSSDELIPLDS